MDELRKQVRRARRRILCQQFLHVLGWLLFAWLGIALAAVAVPKIWALGMDPTQSRIYAVGWSVGAVAAALLTALAWTFWRKATELEAAIEIDRRFALKERVSSSLALDDGEIQSEAGSALVRDAGRRIERIDVVDRFPLRIGPKGLLPLLLAIAVLAVVLFSRDARLDGQGVASGAPAAIQKQVKKSAEDLKRKIAQRRKQAQDENLKDAEAYLRKLEEGLDDLTQNDVADRKNALVKLNDLSKELQERRRALGDGKDIRQQLSRLKNLHQGPADKLAKALKDGDFQKALDELEKLKNELTNDGLNEQQKDALDRQLTQMRQKLQDLADAHRQAKEDLQQQVEEALKGGDLAEASRLQEQLDKLSMQDDPMNCLSKMADKLGKCQQCMKQGDAQQAAAQLDELAQQLRQLQQENDELEMLDGALDQIAQAKDAMNCKQCGGKGCRQCRGGLGQGDGNRKNGRGLGKGRGVGDRPEEENDTGGYRARVPGRVGPGKAVIIGEVSGPNIAGEAREEIKREIASFGGSAAQPVTNQRLPRPLRDHVREYLDSFQPDEGNGDKGPAGEEK